MTETRDAGAPVDDGWRDYDHLQVAAMDHPNPMLRELRERCPVGRSDAHGGFWVLTRYADVGWAARQPDLFCSSPRSGPGPGFPFSDKYPILIPMIGSDPPLHHDFRRPLLDAFSPAAVARLTPMMRRATDELIDRFIQRGEADLAQELAIQLPGLVTSELLDLPEDRRPEFHDWASEIIATGGDTPAFARLVAFIDERHAACTAEPGDDIPSQMLTFRISGRPITKEEWAGTFLLLVLAGLDTTANGAALIFHFLGTRPDVRQVLVDDPARLPIAIEELLRWTTPVPQHSRGVTRDVEVGGRLLRAGDVVQLNWQAANRDPAEFPDPDTFVVDRTPNRHYAFGLGPHRCLGSNLARVELQVMLEGVLGRLPDYELVEGGVRRFPGLNRGMSSLKVRFTPGPRVNP